MADTNYLKLKRRALEKYFSHLNDKQREAVFMIEGPVLILAGAGSGKTTVLANRVANMVYFGNAYNDTYRYAGVTPDDEKFLGDYADGIETDSERLREIVRVNCVNPYNILAITFTNKAANELKDRLHKMLGSAADGIVAATFHSACSRILRREIDKLGYSKSFTIYDTDDSVRVIKSCLKDFNLSDKRFSPKEILREISSAKEAEVDSDEYSRLSEGDFRKQITAKIYTEYQKRLVAANALDFDDIIMLTVRLFEEFPNVLQHYRNLYKYVLVDEYQDANMIQYRLISLLTSERKNICVVGDDDQSIYKFRGATIENILSFENQFENTKVIRLEQNYRSTQNILTCANEVIKNNLGRKGKNLWTAAGDGDKVNLYAASNEQDEARYIAETVLSLVKDGGKYSDSAVLYRMNAQSNAIENAMMKSGVPYKIVGGLKFFERKEVKDILAYLSVIENPNDIVRLRRVINEPKRGIGDATVTELENISMSLGEPIFAVMHTATEYPMLSRAASKLTAFANMMDELREHSELIPLPELLDELMEKTGYHEYMQAQGEEGAMRLENINELKSNMVNYMENAAEPTLSGFLEEISLYTDIDSLDSEADSVTMMTVHSAKGLEFENVFVAGLEENIFPSSRSILAPDDVEEERRLCYVAITRAKRRLYLISARQRMLFGSTTFNHPSRFIAELPMESVKEISPKRERTESQYNKTAPRQETFTGGISYGKKPAAERKTAALFSVGDRVKHNVFGEGTVLNVTAMSSDSLLEIAFDERGTKKIMATFARIEKI